MNDDFVSTIEHTLSRRIVIVIASVFVAITFCVVAIAELIYKTTRAALYIVKNDILKEDFPEIVNTLKSIKRHW